jgi:hypothetical protein
MSYIKPYPQDWPRLVDLITPLNIQQIIDPQAELNYYKGEVSVSMRQLTGELKPKVKTKLGVSIQQDHISRKKTIIEFGTLNDTQVKVTQKELWTNILENTLVDEVPAIIGKQRGIIKPLDLELESLSILDGCEQVYRMEVAYGHFTEVIRRRTMLPISNPCRIIRNDLALNGYLKYNDPIFKRMRSVWRTQWMVGTPRKGWSDLGVQGVSDISTKLVKDKFYQDVGIPQEIKGTFDGTLVEEQVYRLLKRGEMIAIG